MPNAFDAHAVVRAPRRQPVVTLTVEQLYDAVTSVNPMAILVLPDMKGGKLMIPKDGSPAVVAAVLERLVGQLRRQAKEEAANDQLD